MPKINNVFIKGMNQDLAISKNDNQHIYYGLDFDLATETGEDLGIAHNTKGNSLQFSIPDLPPVYTIELDGNTGSVFITINGVGPLTFSISTETTIEDVYNEVVSSLFSTFIAAGEYGVFYNNSQVYVVGYTVDPNVGVTSGLTVNTIVTAQTDLSIIGGCLLGEEIILLTTSSDNTSVTPSNTAGQIWRISYDDATNTVNNLTGTSLTPMNHLVKNDILNLSLANEVYKEMLGRVESSNKGNVYWTDDYNNPQAANIYNPQIAAVPPGLLNWKPDIIMTTPLVTSILDGGNTKTGSYQLAYQLFTRDGAITNYSPSSMPIVLTQSFQNTSSYIDFIGNPAGDIAGKTIQFKIPNIDRRFDFIRLVVVIYEIENVPQIFSFAEVPITEDTMSFTYTGAENHITITPSEFTNPLISFDTCKSFTQKKNRLYPTNTTSENFQLDWDVRTYRFAGATNATTNLGVVVAPGETYLYDRNGAGTLYNGVAALTGISDTLDLVNAYNDESGKVFGLFPGNDYDTTPVNWIDNFQFKYQANGTTIGGEGPNLRYSFFYKDYLGDTALTTIQTVSPFVAVGVMNSGGTTQAIYNPPINESAPNTDGWDAIKNPFYNMLFPSYARGEVYRLGLIGVNTKGEESFVEWIGDIRIPEPWEDTDYDISENNATEMKLRAIGIRFEITNTANIPSDIIGFRFVRVPRTDEDKTRFGVGLTTGLVRAAVSYAEAGGTIQNSWILAFKDGVVTQEGYEFYNNYTFDGVGVGSETLGVIKFPDVDFGKYQINQASHIKKLHKYTVVNTTLNGSQSLTGNTYWASDTNNEAVWMNALIHKFEIIQERGSGIVPINKQVLVGPDSQVLSSFSTAMLGLDYNHVCTYDLAADNEVAGLGTKMLYVNYGSTMSYDPGNVPVENNQYSLVSLCKFNFGQYGGPWRSSRYNNTYISCSDLIPVEQLTTTYQFIDVFGGDTYVSYYVTPMIFFHWAETYGVDEANPSGLGSLYYPFAATQMAWAVAFPTECSINPELRYGKFFNKDQVNQFEAGAPNAIVNKDPIFAKFLSDDFFFNDAYAQENNLKTYTPLPFLIDTDRHDKATTWVSNPKFDREIIDSWRKYPILNRIDLEGMYGESVKITNFNEKLIIHQERAVATISSEELATVPNGEGAVLEAGTGKLLSRYDYISKNTGAFHQHAVVNSPSGVYHFDSRLQKLYKLGQGLEPISDILGLSAFLRANTTGNMRTEDTVLLAKGVHGEFDSKYNKAYFTFQKTEPFTFTTASINASGQGVYTGFNSEFLSYYNTGQTITIGGNQYYIVSLTATELILDNLVPGNSGTRTVSFAFTFAFNEFLKNLEDFYSFNPPMYLATGKRLLSVNPDDDGNTMYLHNVGDYGVFYDRTPTTSVLSFLSNYPDPSKIPTFRLDVIEFWTEVYDNLNQNITLESITGLVVENDYQTTGNSLTPLTLGPLGNYDLVRYERTWKTNRLFDFTNPALTLKPYFKDKYAKITMFYDNALNRNFKLHDVTSTITLSY